MSGGTADAFLKPAELDESLYKLDAEEKAFFKQQTGIADDEELKQHILAVQRDAYAVFPYPCIYRFAFTQLKIFRLPAYPQLLNLARTRTHPILLDIGCCFGNDLRKAVVDGYPANACIGSDLRPEFWDLGYRLFRDSSSTVPASFVGGDAFEPTMLAPEQPFTEALPNATPFDLSNLAGKGSLNPLHSRVSAIHASSFFHLFTEEKQAYLARALAPLLSPEPGSMLLGSHMALREKGACPGPGPWNQDIFAHGPESWIQLWEDVFGKGKVKVGTNVVKIDLPRQKVNDESPWVLLEWSVVRV